MIRKSFGRFILVLVFIPFSLGSDELQRQACKGLQNNNCANDSLQCEIGEHIDIKYTFYVFVNTYSACSTINCSIQDWYACKPDHSICRIEFSAGDRLKLDDQCNGKMYCDLLSPVLNSTYCNKTTNRTVCFKGFSYQEKGYFIIYDCESAPSSVSSQPDLISTQDETGVLILSTTSTAPTIQSADQNESQNESQLRDRNTQDWSVIIGGILASLILITVVIVIVTVVIKRKAGICCKGRGTSVTDTEYQTPTAFAIDASAYTDLHPNRNMGGNNEVVCEDRPNYVNVPRLS